MYTKERERELRRSKVFSTSAHIPRTRFYLRKRPSRCYSIAELLYYSISFFKNIVQRTDSFVPSVRFFQTFFPISQAKATWKRYAFEHNLIRSALDIRKHRKYLKKKKKKREIETIRKVFLIQGKESRESGNID